MDPRAIGRQPVDRGLAACVPMRAWHDAHARRGSEVTGDDLARLLDAGAAANVIKIKYQHKRPFQVAEGAVCLSSRAKKGWNTARDYPSGHTALSWDTALILAELVPEAASDILARARAFGQSRIVCGVHNTSAVEAGWMTATAVFAMQLQAPEFQKDLDSARTELAAFRAHFSSKPTGCDAEAETLSKNPY